MRKEEEIMKAHIGVLALQGDFAEHAEAINRSGARASEIRHSWQLQDVDGLIIPGGESTALATLTADNKDPIFDVIRERALAGMPIYGTCMGTIFLAREIEGSRQGRLALMDITVKRNAFGPQRLSFETMIDIPVLGKAPFHAVFIRGPIINSVGAKAQVLARIPQGIVMVRQDNLLVTAFHPEITGDNRVHELFLSMVKENQDIAASASRSPALIH
jgi:pyridoxal 5'-phosphate synthase pdxT subunit